MMSTTHFGAVLVKGVAAVVMLAVSTVAVPDRVAVFCDVKESHVFYASIALNARSEVYGPISPGSRRICQSLDGIADDEAVGGQV